MAARGLLLYGTQLRSFPGKKTNQCQELRHAALITIQSTQGKLKMVWLAGSLTAAGRDVPSQGRACDAGGGLTPTRPRNP